MTDLISYSELQNHFSNETFVLKTQRQLAKDFEKFNLFFDDDFQTTPLDREVIEDKIAELVAELMKEGESRLLQLLYTIDIPEKDFLSLTVQPNFLQLLSEKILLREAYKVFLRGKISSGQM